MLVFACSFLIGSYFCYDIPGVLKDQFENEEHVSASDSALMYSIYSYPNTILPLFGGIFLDKLGMRVGLIVFTTILTIGQFIVASFSGEPLSIAGILSGRFVFGLGGENMSVAQSSMITNWFKG